MTALRNSFDWFASCAQQTTTEGVVTALMVPGLAEVATEIVAEPETADPMTEPVTIDLAAGIEAMGLPVVPEVGPPMAEESIWSSQFAIGNCNADNSQGYVNVEGCTVTYGMD